MQNDIVKHSRKRLPGREERLLYEKVPVELLQEIPPKPTNQGRTNRRLKNCKLDTRARLKSQFIVGGLGERGGLNVPDDTYQAHYLCDTFISSYANPIDQADNFH